MGRIFLMVLDSAGIGELPDACCYKDEGSNTFLSCAQSSEFFIPNMDAIGLTRIDGQEKLADRVQLAMTGCKEDLFLGAVARLCEASKGKDTTIGHWEIAGLISERPLPTFPNGFPTELIEKFEASTGRKVLCNLPYSGTKVISDYGQEAIDTGALIVYTSADSVFQIAAHEDYIPLADLYRYCETARELCTGEYGVGRVIARPFVGTAPDFVRTSNRHDYSLKPTRPTMLDVLSGKGFDVIAVGKIFDIFAGSGITESVRTHGNAEGIDLTLSYMRQDFNGLCFINLVDFDMLYGHRNDVDGYARALAEFDHRLPELTSVLREDDILMITADHGCDPATLSTDHSREYVPLLVYGKNVRAGVNLGTRDSFADIGATVLDFFGIHNETDGTSFLTQIMK